MTRRANPNPFRAVVEAQRVTTITNNGYGREGEHDEWTLRLECGHWEYRYAGPHSREPRRVCCERCGKIERSA